MFLGSDLGRLFFFFWKTLGPPGTLSAKKPFSINFSGVKRYIDFTMRAAWTQWELVLLKGGGG